MGSLKFICSGCKTLQRLKLSEELRGQDFIRITCKSCWTKQRYSLIRLEAKQVGN